jgi:hypothetical protein
VRFRGWSAVFRVPSADGTSYFKATVPAFAHEARVIEVLARHRPDAVTEVVAADAARGWMLTRDAGVPLEKLAAEDALRHWEVALPQYAQLQLDVTSAAAELNGLLPLDRRTRCLPSWFDAMLADEEALLVERGGLNRDEYERLCALSPWVREACAELEASPIGDTIQHDDLGSADVFPAGGRYRFLDWGDSCVSFPLLSLTVTLRVIEYLYDLPEGSAEVGRLRDAYLEPWTGLAPRAELTRLASLSRPLGQVSRAAIHYDDARRGDWEIDPDDVAWVLRLVIEPEAWRDAVD